MKLRTQLGLGPGHIVLDGDSAPPHPKGPQLPQFSVHSHCGHMAGWIKMPLSMEVGLDADDFVLDGDRASPLKRGHSPTTFGPCLLWPNCWMIKMILGTEVGLGPGYFVLDGNPAPAKKGAQPPSPNFRLMWPNGLVDQDVTW